MFFVAVPVAEMTWPVPSKSFLIAFPMEDINELPPSEMAWMLFWKKEDRPGKNDLVSESRISLKVSKMSDVFDRMPNREILGCSTLT